MTNNVKRKCLNCGYERQPNEESEFNPASECPKCHAIYEKVEKVYEERLLKEQQQSREETITDRNPSPVSVFSILLPIAYFFKTIYPLHGVIDTICNVLLLLIFVGCVIMMIYRIQSEGFWHFIKSIFLDYVNIIESFKQNFKEKNERSGANSFFNELMRNRGLRNASTNRSGRRRKR